MKRIRKVFSFFIKKHPRKTIGVIIGLFLLYWFSLPAPLFNDPTCMVLEDKDGNLLGARIAADGQWRFPHDEQVSEKFIAAITEFEDRRFYYHPGVDPVGIGRAIKQNITNGEIVSGGSTISMQVIRMARKGKARTIFQKIIEAILATRMELSYSKSEIMAHYASNAPFGGNVVGLDAASWRYFGKNQKLLSWAEAATLAVLPNSPSLIHPGRNRKALLDKRNRLLDRLLTNGSIDSMTCSLAKEEELPEKPLTLPRLAPHLLDRAYREHFRHKKGKRTRLKTTINRHLQKQSNDIVNRHHQSLAGNGIHNMAAIIIEVKTGNVLAYIGNVAGAGKDHGAAVDIIKAPRSTGSILKPLLYAMMLQDGQLLPSNLISDIPTQLNGYRPENFFETYDGVVSANRVLVRSLNVPIIRMLQDYGLEKFHFGLQKVGLSTINKPPSHYGLPLALGGAETTLWDITSCYASMSRTLGNFYNYDGQYDKKDFRKANYVFDQKIEASTKKELLKEAAVLSASAIWLSFEAMQELERPNSSGDWQRFNSSQQIAWKTGTSFGFRDAWAVGITSKYAVGVWVGNADGEGRPGLIGVQSAAPVLFDLFDMLPSSEWFDQPYDEMIAIPVCKKSGYRALDICDADTLWVQKAGLRSDVCPHHKILHLDPTEQWQVNAQCESPINMVHKPWFVLPPIEEYYFKSKNPSYISPPNYRSDCSVNIADNQPMQLIYPKRPTKIYVPIDLDGNQSRTVFKVAHRNPDTRIHWHIDKEYIGSTQNFHHLEIAPTVGPHTLSLTDEQGYRLEQKFEIIEKENEK